MNANMKEKALRILLCARTSYDHSRERGDQMYAELHAEFGRKPVERKRVELKFRGYIDDDGFITQKGRAALAAHGRQV